MPKSFGAFRLFLIVLLSFLAFRSGANPPALEGVLDTDRQAVAALTNEARSLESHGPVALDETLNQVAQRFAEDMRLRRYFSHVSPDGKSMVDRLREGHVAFLAAGENIAMGQKTPQVVMDAWLRSPGHRSNIMGARYDRLGLGRAGDYWVMVLTNE